MVIHVSRAVHKNAAPGWIVVRLVLSSCGSFLGRFSNAASCSLRLPADAALARRDPPR